MVVEGFGKDQQNILTSNPLHKFQQRYNHSTLLLCNIVMNCTHHKHYMFFLVEMMVVVLVGKVKLDILGYKEFFGMFLGIHIHNSIHLQRILYSWRTCCKFLMLVLVVELRDSRTHNSWGKFGWVSKYIRLCEEEDNR
jgi:hypothetical protein